MSAGRYIFILLKSFLLVFYSDNKIIFFRHLPDAQLESREPKIYKELSSIFVKVPEGRYGTR